VNRERLLAAGAVGTIAVALLVAGVVPGVLAGPDSREVARPGSVQIADAAVAAENVSGATVDLRVETRLRHSGNPSENVTLVVRAVDADSGLLQTTRRIDVGTLRGDRETTANATLGVDREGGYRIETVVYRDGERVDEGRTSLSGLSALQPPYAQSDVTFAETDVLPALSYSVADAGQNRTTLNVSTALTNGGDTAPQDLRVTVVARQAESNVVADRTSVRVGSIRPGRTVSPSVRLTVPEGYNYYLDAILWRDGVSIDTARSTANLDPSRTISVDETREEVKFEVGDFESEGGTGGQPTSDAARLDTQAPGFGPVVALAALLSAGLLARRWSA
jgi:PGF-CTERM protein